MLKSKTNQSIKSSDVARMQSAVAKKSRGQVAKGSYVGRVQAAAARNVSKCSKK